MRSGSPLTAAVALLLPSLLAALAAAPAPPPAFVFFAHDYARALLYDNNPEQLRARDLADAAPAGAGVAHLQVRGVQGALRAWFELQVSTNFSLGFAVLLVNSGAAPVDVLVEASGFVTGLAGGLPFAQAFNGAGGGANRSVVPPNGSLALLREDFAGAPGDIFSGLVDFTVTGGPVTVSTAAYRDFAAVDARSLVYEGYVTSTDPGNDDEARVVKGVMAASRVVSAPLAFVVNDGNPKNSTLEFAWTPYVAGAFSDEVVVGPSFTSHDNPLANANAVASDMVAVLMPGWGVVNPQGCCDASGLHYNVGNWAITYNLRGSVTHAGSAAVRVVNISITATGCLAPLAIRPSPGSPWVSTTLWNPGDSTVYASVAVAPGTTQAFSAQLVLGGPACGGLRHEARVF